MYTFVLMLDVGVDTCGKQHLCHVNISSVIVSAHNRCYGKDTMMSTRVGPWHFQEKVSGIVLFLGCA